MNNQEKTEVKELGSLLLDVGANLLNSGASCSRIRITMRRLATSSDYTPHISIAPKSISLTLNDEEDNPVFSGMRSIIAQGVNFKTISGISRLSWDALEKDFSIPQIREELNRLLSVMNRAIYESAKRKFVMTCFAAIIDTRTRRITYSNAGHNFPYLYRPRSVPSARGEGEFLVLMSRGNRLGDLPESSFSESTQELQPSDVLVFYTDGVVECENPHNEEYGEKRFRGAIRNASDMEPAQMRDSIVSAAALFYGDRPRKDDITMVVACIR